MIPKFTNNKIAVFSDLHLGVHSNSSQWHKIATDWAEWFIADLTNKGIKDLVFCGDWHHNRSEISVDTLNISADILAMFEDFNLYIITGNHDIYYKHRTDVHSLNIFKHRSGIHIIDTPLELKTNGKVIHFLPWGFDLNSFSGPADVCFGHLEIVSFQMNSAKQCEEGFKSSDLLNQYKLVMSGHFHARHERKFSDGNILYVGNPFQMDFGDAGNDKGYYILDLDTLNYNFIKNTVSPIHNRLYLSELVKNGSFTPSIVNSITNSFVKFSVDKNISQDHLTILSAKLNGLNPASLVMSYDITFNKLLNNTNDHDFSGIDITRAIEEFINLLDIENKQSIIQYTLDIYKRCSL